jgi:hypothetical protein
LTPFVNLEGVSSFFESAAKYADGMVLWGGFGYFGDTVDNVAAQLRTWAPTIVKHCALVAPSDE